MQRAGIAIPKRFWRSGAWCLLLALGGGAAAPTALALDWSGVPAKEVVLFYPGQASWEWALTQSDHSGNKKFRAGKNCKECHDTEQADMGAKIVSGKKLEPNPIAGKPGSLAVNIQTANDGERLYVRLQWEAPPPTGSKMETDEEVHATMMLSDGSVKEATRAGCWGACHDDMIGMASAPSGVKITKYLAASRTKITRQGGDENFKSDVELGKLIDQGVFLEYWQARLTPGKPAQGVSGYILDKRHEDEASVVEATANNEDGKWTVVLSRKLNAGGRTHENITPGAMYYIGFAIHEDYTEHRFHYVSFGYTLSLDEGSADFVAKKL